MAKRKYTKRSDYWNKFNKENKLYVPIGKDGEVQPDLLGEPFILQTLLIMRFLMLEGNRQALAILLEAEKIEQLL